MRRVEFLIGLLLAGMTVLSCSAESPFVRGLRLKGSDADDAVDAFRDAIHAGDRAHLAYAYIGDIELQRGRIEAAIEAYSNAIARDPNNAFFYNLRGRAYQRAGREELAFYNWERAQMLESERSRQGISVVMTPELADILAYRQLYYPELRERMRIIRGPEGSTPMVVGLPEPVAPPVTVQPPPVVLPPPEVVLPPPEVVQPPPVVVQPPPEVVQPPPEVVQPPPQIVQPPPEVVQPPPEVVQPPPQIVQPPPLVVQPPPQVAATPTAAPRGPRGRVVGGEWQRTQAGLRIKLVDDGERVTGASLVDLSVDGESVIRFNRNAQGGLIGYACAQAARGAAYVLLRWQLSVSPDGRALEGWREVADYDTASDSYTNRRWEQVSFQPASN